MTGKLYIPIWLYSNLASCAYDVFTQGFFTFQSGYIQIGVVANGGSVCIKLYIPIWLYSNLELLRICQRCITLYIPIWLYSNDTFSKNTFVAISSLHSNLVIFK